jgi:hypothetical protein
MSRDPPPRFFRCDEVYKEATAAAAIVVVATAVSMTVAAVVAYTGVAWMGLRCAILASWLC